MRIKAMQVRDGRKARDIVHSFPRLAWAKDWLPTLDPSFFWPRSYAPPSLPHMVKLHLLVLHPKRGSGELEGWELARAAARLLEERHGVALDWACGLRASGAVWLLVKPWAAPPGGKGRREWFYVDGGDLAALRAALGGPAGAARKAGPGGRER